MRGLLTAGTKLLKRFQGAVPDLMLEGKESYLFPQCKMESLTVYRRLTRKFKKSCLSSGAKWKYTTGSFGYYTWIALMVLLWRQMCGKLHTETINLKSSHQSNRVKAWTKVKYKTIKNFSTKGRERKQSKQSEDKKNLKSNTFHKAKKFSHDQQCTSSSEFSARC